MYSIRGQEGNFVQKLVSFLGGGGQIRPPTPNVHSALELHYTVLMQFTTAALGKGVESTKRVLESNSREGEEEEEVEENSRGKWEGGRGGGSSVVLSSPGV